MLILESKKIEDVNSVNILLDAYFLGVDTKDEFISSQPFR